MKTPVSSWGTAGRFGWIAAAALALSACTGPGLEPPDRASNSAGSPGKYSDAGAQHGGSDMDNGSTGTGGHSPTGGSSNPTGGGAGKAGSGGSSGMQKPPESTQDAGLMLDAGDAGDDDAG